MSKGQKRIKKKKILPKKNSKATEVPKQVQRKVAKRSTLLIQVATRKTYVDIRGKPRKEVDPDASHTGVLEQDLPNQKGRPPYKLVFEDKVTRIVGDVAKV